jgi:hypothetical protein
VQGLPALNLGLQVRKVLHGCLCGIGIIPKVRRSGSFFQLFNLAFFDG